MGNELYGLFSAMNDVFSGSQKTKEETNLELETLASEYYALVQKRKELESRCFDLKKAIIQRLGTNGHLELDSIIITLKTTKKSVLDRLAIKRALDITKYQKEITSVYLSVKCKKPF